MTQHATPEDAERFYRQHIAGTPAEARLTLEAENARLEAENKRLREALETIANRSTAYAGTHWDNCDHYQCIAQRALDKST